MKLISNTNQLVNKNEELNSENIELKNILSNKLEENAYF